MLVPLAAVPVAAAVAWMWPIVVPREERRRWQQRSTGRFLFEFTLRLIVTTVVLEEVAFRGLLFGAARIAWEGFWCPALLSASLFGLWHISPTLTDARLTGRAVAMRKVAGTVITTIGFGLALAGLRNATDSLWPPIALHYAVNASGMAAVFVSSRRFPADRQDCAKAQSPRRKA